MQPNEDLPKKMPTPLGRDYIMAVCGAVLVLLIMGVITLMQNARTTLPYQDAGSMAAWIPQTVKKWSPQINEVAKKYNLDANLIAIIMTLESGGNPEAKSEANALGLMQVTPPTAEDIAAKHLKKPVTTYDLPDPKTNIEFGAAYLAWLRDEFGAVFHGPDYTRSVELIAAGYNGGPGTANALEKGEGLRDPQPVIYSRDAFNMWRERVSRTSPTFDRWKERGGQALLDAAEKSEVKE